MTFYYRMLWDTINLLKDKSELKEVVNYFSKGFVLLFGGGLFIFLSLAIDMYTLFFRGPQLLSINMGLMFTGFLLLFAFLILFLIKTLGEMNTLKQI